MIGRSDDLIILDFNSMCLLTFSKWSIHKLPPCIFSGISLKKPRASKRGHFCPLQYFFNRTSHQHNLFPLANTAFVDIAGGVIFYYASEHNYREDIRCIKREANGHIFLKSKLVCLNHFKITHKNEAIHVSTFQSKKVIS